MDGGMRALYDRSLELVNKARAKTGKEPLSELRQGVPKEPLSCPLALSLDGGEVAVGVDAVWFKHKADAVAARRAWGTRYIKAVENLTPSGWSPVVTSSQPSRWNASEVNAEIDGWYGVTLPKELSHLVFYFDGGHIPELRV